MLVWKFIPFEKYLESLPNSNVGLLLKVLFTSIPVAVLCFINVLKALFSSTFFALGSFF
jgi:hypothetical protein